MTQYERQQKIISILERRQAASVRELSSLLFYAQEVAGQHCQLLGTDYDSLAKLRMFWAVTRHRVQITRLPVRGETITVETWPMPTTRVAYPRSVIAYDAQGNECFRAISLWVLMDLDKRSMILPGKSGITRRPMTVTVRALNRHGEEVTVTGSGLFARAMCHELDHLDGKLFIDCAIRLSED